MAWVHAQPVIATRTQDRRKPQESRALLLLLQLRHHPRRPSLAPHASSLHPLLEVWVGVPLLPHAQEQLGLHMVATHHEAVVDLPIKAVLHARPIFLGRDAGAPTDRGAIANVDGDVGQLEVEVELIKVELHASDLRILVEETLQQPLLVLVHHGRFRGNPTACNAKVHCHVRGATPVQQPAMSLASLVSPIERIVNHAVGVAEGVVLRHHLAVPPHLREVLCHLFRLCEPLIQVGLRCPLPWEGVPRCLADEVLSKSHVAFGDVGRLARTKDETGESRI
mmetsp:Transcript_15202/g.35578  ORF Transcript_15202/g.35578 Transcript_15202/m.35578 type:complete len:280 (+) Transcript_15202:296-1135(+)